MKIFNLTQKQFKELDELEISSGIANTQGELYHMPEDIHEVKTLFKRIIISDNDYFYNKLETILKLMEQERDYAFPQLVYPTGLVAIDGNLEGFTMPFIQGQNLKSVLKNRNITFGQKKNYLIQVGNLLEQMKEYRKNSNNASFYLNDIHEANFIVEENTGLVKYVDIDSSIIAELSPDRAMYLRPIIKFKNLEEKYQIAENGFYGPYVKASDDTEIYSYMTMILNLIAQDNIFMLQPNQFIDYINYLEDLGYPKGLIEAFQKLYTNEPNINPVKNLEGLEDISRGMYRVYIRTLK